MSNLTLLRKPAIAAAILALVAMIAIGCGGDDDGAEPAANGNGANGNGAAENGEVTDAVIGWSNPNAANPILNALTDGLEQEANASGIEVAEYDSGLDPDTQLSGLNTMLGQGIDGMITWTLDPGAVESAYRDAAGQDIPIVAFNSDSEFFNTVVETEVSSQCGPYEEAAQYIAEQSPGGRVLAIGGPPVPALTMRVECFVNAAEGAGLEIVGQQDNLEDSVDGGNQVMQDLLTQHGDDIDAVWAYNDRSALGASRALAGSGLEVASTDGDEGVVLVGCNGEPEAIDAIRDGDLTMTFDENPPEAGAAAAQALLPVLVDGGTVEDMPERILIETTRWDSTNVDDYIPWDQRDVVGQEVGVEN